MKKYNLCAINDSGESKKWLLSSDYIKKLDAFTSSFENERQALQFFKIYGNDFKLIIYGDKQAYPIFYSNYLNYINDLDVLSDSFANQYNNFDFLRTIIKMYEKNANVKHLVCNLKKSLKRIDKYSFEMVPLYKYFNLNDFYYSLKQIKNISNKESLLSNIEQEYSKIQNYLLKIFNTLIYNNGNINYINLRTICVITCKYNNQLLNKEKKHVKSK